MLHAGRPKAPTAKWIALGGLLLLVLVLLSLNLTNWPTPWYDEGITLQAASNLAEVRDGGQSPVGLDGYGPISSGPVVTIPIAALMRLFEKSLLWGRVVIVAYGILAVGAIFLLAERLFDLKTAIVSVLLLLVAPLARSDTSATFLGLGRMAMGEVPQLFYLAVGWLLWSQSLVGGRRVYAAWAGLSFGLAILAKQQAVLVIPTLMVIWIVDRLRGRQLHLFQLAIPVAACLAALAAWIALDSFMGGATGGGAQGILGRLGTQVGLFAPQQMVHNTRGLLATGALTWGLPGLVYGIYLSRRNDKLSLGRLALAEFCLVWLAWFTVGSIGWLRYAFVPNAFLSLFAAKLVIDVAEGFSVRGQHAGRNLAVAMAFLLMILSPLQDALRDILLTRDSSPFDVAEYIDANVPADSVILSFEAEVAFLSDRDFAQPSAADETLAIRHVQFGEPYPESLRRDGSPLPEFLLEGPFAKLTEFYRPVLDESDYAPVISIGPYDLFRRVGR